MIFIVLGLENVINTPYLNIASVQLLKKLGFTYAHDEFYPPTGLYHPSYLMTDHDYRLRQAEQI